MVHLGVLEAKRMSEESIRLEKAALERQARLAQVGRCAINFINLDDSYARIVGYCEKHGQPKSSHYAISGADYLRHEARLELCREIEELKEYDRANGGAL